MKELAKHLRWVIREEIKLELEISTEPKINVPGQLDVGVVGTQVDFVETLNAKYLSEEGEFIRKAKRLRQSREMNGQKLN